MTPRRFGSRRLTAVLIVAGFGLIAVTGCDPRFLVYFLQPNDPTIAANGPSLLEKKVVIICNVGSEAQGEFPSLERDLPRDLGTIFKKKVKKIDLVSPDKIATWSEAHPNWSDPGDVGRDFEADTVIFLEVEQFQIQSPGDLNMLHGESKVHVQLFDMDYPKNSKDKPIKDQPREAHSKYDTYVETVFPNTGPLPIDSGNSRSSFKKTFQRVVAKQISWHFVEHAPDDSIQDSRIER
jgi:hypothetical protein